MINFIVTSIKTSLSVIIKPTATFERIMPLNDYGQYFFLIFYGVLNNFIGYLHQPRQVLMMEDYHMMSKLEVFIRVIMSALDPVIEVIAGSVAIFLLLLALRRTVPFNNIVKAISYSLAPLLYLGAPYGYLAGENLRFWERGSSVWSAWGLPYAAVHALFIYSLAVGLWTAYKTRNTENVRLEVKSKVD